MAAARANLLWARTDAEWRDTRLEDARWRVPPQWLEKMPNFRRWQDVQMGLVGKLLLRRVLLDAGHALDDLGPMAWTAEGRPSLPRVADFNITHSGGVVACVLAASVEADAETITLGLDVEQVKPVPVEDLEAVFTRRERDAVRNADNPDAELARTWTFKEAVIKADGRGVGLDLQTFDSASSPVHVDARVWHVQRIELVEGYACHLASDREDLALDVHAVAVDSLLSGDDAGGRR